MRWCLAFCCWSLTLVSGWTNFQPLAPSRNFSFRLFPEASPGAPGRLTLPPASGEEEAMGSKVERLGRAFRSRVRRLRELSGRLELVFLVDESSSVGQANFLNELKFVRKLLSDFPVVSTATRVAIVTFSSKNNVVARVDYISTSRAHQHKCALLSREIPAITYRGGGTYTKGAFQQAAVRPRPPRPALRGSSHLQLPSSSPVGFSPSKSQHTKLEASFSSRTNRTILLLSLWGCLRRIGLRYFSGSRGRDPLISLLHPRLCIRARTGMVSPKRL